MNDLVHSKKFRQCVQVIAIGYNLIRERRSRKRTSYVVFLLFDAEKSDGHERPPRILEENEEEGHSSSVAPRAAPRSAIVSLRFLAISRRRLPVLRVIEAVGHTLLFLQDPRRRRNWLCATAQPGIACLLARSKRQDELFRIGNAYEIIHRGSVPRPAKGPFTPPGELSDERERML